MLQNCCVCLEEKTDHKKLNCVHTVCVSCYENLIKFDITNCPMCRCEFRKKSNNKIDDDDDGEILVIELYEIIYRRRRRNITYEQKLFNKAKAKQRIINSKNKKKGRLSKLTNCF